MNALATPFEIDKVLFPPARFGTFGNLASDVIQILIGASFAISVFFIILSGIKFVTSGGDPKKLAAAQSQITYAIIGLVVTALAFVILRLVQFFLRSNIPIT